MSSPEHPKKPEKKVDPASITGYLISGMVLYGGLGWLVDRWVGTSDVYAPIGVIFGLAAGLFLTFRQLSVLERQEREALTRKRRLERLDAVVNEEQERAQQDPKDSQDPQNKHEQ
jgi:F0F1-type ATP synthase assembly protein I